MSKIIVLFETLCQVRKLSSEKNQKGAYQAKPGVPGLGSELARHLSGELARITPEDVRLVLGVTGVNEAKEVTDALRILCVEPAPTYKAMIWAASHLLDQLKPQMAGAREREQVETWCRNLAQRLGTKVEISQKTSIDELRQIHKGLLEIEDRSKSSWRQAPSPQKVAEKRVDMSRQSGRVVTMAEAERKVRADNRPRTVGKGLAALKSVAVPAAEASSVEAPEAKTG